MRHGIRFTLVARRWLGPWEFNIERRVWTRSYKLIWGSGVETLGERSVFV